MVAGCGVVVRWDGTSDSPRNIATLLTGALFQRRANPSKEILDFANPGLESCLERRRGYSPLTCNSTHKYIYSLKLWKLDEGIKWVMG